MTSPPSGRVGIGQAVVRALALLFGVGAQTALLSPTDVDACPTTDAPPGGNAPRHDQPGAPTTAPSGDQPCNDVGPAD